MATIHDLNLIERRRILFCMSDVDVYNSDAIARRLHQQVEGDALRITAHAHQEMVEEGALLDEVRSVLRDATVVENYPEHKRGPCSLVCRRTAQGRYLHIVCTTGLEFTIVITVYEPRPPKWATPFKRGTST
ncbi:MAG: DUF4258 domain-containing protein [Lentisphaerae bacterium]|nr:DUF4258 domain-containing protein [Lentisphaerota bacterium]